MSTAIQHSYQETTSSLNASRFTVWMREHPLMTYFALAFAGTWLLDLPMVLGKDGLGLFTYNVPLPLYAILFILGSFTGPTLSAFLVTSILEGKDGRKKLFRRYGQWRVGLPWYGLAILAFPILYIVAGSILLHGIPFADLRANGLTFFTNYLPALLIFPALITWGEEPGWRGFALTRMQEYYHPFISSVTVGFLHGLWHLPIFLLISGPVALGPFNLVHFVVNTSTIIALTLIWTWIFNNAKGSILIAVLLHASLNASQAWMGTLIPNYPNNAGKIAAGFYVVAAMALIFVTKGQLGYRSSAVKQNSETKP